MCMEIKHFVSGSPICLENCVKSRGEVSWSHGQVRLICYSSPEIWQALLNAAHFRCCAAHIVCESTVTREHARPRFNGFPIVLLCQNISSGVALYGTIQLISNFHGRKLSTGNIGSWCNWMDVQSSKIMKQDLESNRVAKHLMQQCAKMVLSVILCGGNGCIRKTFYAEMFNAVINVYIF